MNFSIFVEDLFAPLFFFNYYSTRVIIFIVYVVDASEYLSKVNICLASLSFPWPKLIKYFIRVKKNYELEKWVEKSIPMKSNG